MAKATKRPTVAGGGRPAAGGSCARGPTGYRQGPVGLGTTHFYRFFITYRLCQPVIYEYTGGSNFSPKLTWPQRNRNYYRVGDIIFFNSVSQRFLPRIYPTLARKEEDKTVLDWIIETEIFGPSPDITTAQVIESITPSNGSPGKGMVKTKPILFFGKTPVLLAEEEGNRYNIRTLSDTFVHIKLAASLNNILPFIQIVMEVIQMVMTGLLKTAVSRGIAVYILRKQALHAATDLAKKQAAKSVAKMMLKNVASATATATTAFVLAFLKDASSSNAEMLLRNKAAPDRKTDYKILENAIKAGAIAFSLKFFDECLGATLSSLARQSGFEKTAKEYIIKKLVALITTEPTGVLLKAYRNAVLDRERQRTGKSPQAQMEMAKELKSWFTGQMKSILKDLIVSQA